MHTVAFRFILVIFFFIAFSILSPKAKAEPLPQIAAIDIEVGKTELAPLLLITPIEFSLENQGTWLLIGNTILTSPNKTIVLNWNGIGGISILGRSFISDIQEAQQRGKTIWIKVTGAAVSMHAFTACAADKITLPEGAYLRFHMPFVYRSILYGLITFKNFNANPADQGMSDFYIDLCQRRGVLTQSDVDAIRDHKEVIKRMHNGKVITDVIEDDSAFNIHIPGSN